MKPRTKFEHRVYNLSLALPKLSKEQRLWAQDKCLRHIGYRNKKGIYCLDCGHHWNGPQEASVCDCPKCGTKLKLETTRKKKLDQKDGSFAIIDVSEEFQVVRIFDIFCYHRAGKEKNVYISEVIQQFIIPGEKHQFVSRLRRTNWYSDSFYGDLEIRCKDHINTYNFIPNQVFPKMKVLPIYRRNGFKASFRGISPFTFFRAIVSDSKAETLLKAGQFDLFRVAAKGDSRTRIDRYWDSIKICIRNNYVVKDASIWFDHIVLLERHGKDIRNPKYICPENLIKDHNRAIRKAAALRRKLDLEKKKEEIEKAEIIYQNQKKDFFGLVLKDGNITVKVMETVQEFYDEGDLHKHCLFANSYYAREDSLVLSAKINGRPVETVEISLTEMKIKQSRGLANKASKYNNQIVSLVNSNLHRIKKIYNKQQKVS